MGSCGLGMAPMVAVAVAAARDSSRRVGDWGGCGGARVGGPLTLRRVHSQRAVPRAWHFFLCAGLLSLRVTVLCPHILWLVLVMVLSRPCVLVAWQLPSMPSVPGTRHIEWASTVATSESTVCRLGIWAVATGSKCSKEQLLSSRNGSVTAPDGETVERRSPCADAGTPVVDGSASTAVA